MCSPVACTDVYSHSAAFGLSYDVDNMRDVGKAIKNSEAFVAHMKKVLLTQTNTNGPVSLSAGLLELQAHRRADFSTYGSRESGVPTILFQV